MFLFYLCIQKKGNLTYLREFIFHNMTVLQIIKKIWLYFKRPVRLYMDLCRLKNKRLLRKYGIEQIPPNYIFFNRFDNNCNVIDVGCGFEAELSVTLIEKYQVKTVVVDPTLKHEQFIRAIENRLKPKFRYFQYALSAENGETIFYEAENCESGSLLNTHRNIQTHPTTQYKVQLLDLPTLISKTGFDEVDYMKIDLEGEEYNLFNEKNLKGLKNIKQLFVEFHHISVKGYSRKDTLKVVKRIRKEGFKSFTFDGLNYLFYK